MMSDDKQTPESQEQEASAASGGEAAPQDDLARLEAENAELRDKVLRTAAELENYRKRAEREIGDTRNYAIAGFARDMLAATDSLERALMAVPEEARNSADTAMKSLIEGIEMTEREMQRLLAKHGIQPIEAEGQKFDPHRHQAMFDVPDPSVPEGTVVQVVQPGFSIGDRVLRPAMVGVAKGGPKQPGGNDEANADAGQSPDAEPSGQAQGESGIDKSV